MIKVENVLIEGFEPAIRAMRNPMNSWDRIDSGVEIAYTNVGKDSVKLNSAIIIGPNDLDLMQRLAKAGVEHATYRRMIAVWLDITAPLYWWKEMDRYTVGKTQISCSTMHKIAEKDFVMDDFSREHLITATEDELVTIDINGNPHHYSANGMIYMMCKTLNHYRKKYLETKDKKYWWQLIQLLPSSYNQKRTIMLNYEVLAKIYRERKDHKLDEWREFCDWIKTLPYAKEVITGEP